MRSRLPFAALLCTLLAGCQVFSPSIDPAGRQRFDHYDPVALNELAALKAREGDITTAWILLERAARLAPHDPRVMRNVEVIRAYRAGTLAPVPEESPSQAPSVPASTPGDAADAQVAEPPPLWNPR